MLKNKYIWWKKNIGIGQINICVEKQIYILKDKDRDWADRYIKWQTEICTHINIFVEKQIYMLKDKYRYWTDKYIWWKTNIYKMT